MAKLIDGNRLELFDALQARPEFASTLQDVLGGLNVRVIVRLSGKRCFFKFTRIENPPIGVRIKEMENLDVTHPT